MDFTPMETKMPLRLLVVVCLLADLLPSAILACSPTQELSLREKIQEADVLLLGEVLKLHKETQIPGNAYTAELKIYCVLKAPRNIPVNAVHNISEVGVIDGRCYSVNLEVNKQYILLGYTVGSEIRPYDDGIEATAENIHQVSLVCGMSPRLPAGIAPGDSMRCPMHVDEEGCIINAPVGGDPKRHDYETEAGHERQEVNENSSDFDRENADREAEKRDRASRREHGVHDGDGYGGHDIDDADDVDAKEYEMASAVHDVGSAISQLISTLLLCVSLYFL